MRCGVEHVVHPNKGEAQQHTRRCYGCGEVGHCLWACPKKAARPRMGEVQHKEVRKLVVETGERNKAKREWRMKEKKVASKGQLEEQQER